MSDCRHWNEKSDEDKMWANYKTPFAAAYHQIKQMQGGSVSTPWYHSENAAVAECEDEMAEAIIGALANLATSTVVDRTGVASLIQGKSCLVKQLDERTPELKAIIELFKKERTGRRFERNYNY
jgi:hypothetical protein